MDTEEKKKEHTRLERADRVYKTFSPEKTNWISSSASWRSAFSRLSSEIVLPFKSIATFASCWVLLEIGWPLLILFGIVSAGSVWTISAAIPCMFILVYGLLLVNGANIVRALIIQASERHDNLVKAIARGYLWTILSIGVIYVTHEYFTLHLPLLFQIPVIYIIPIEILGNTIPIPIPLGFSGFYINIVLLAAVYVIGITGSCIGGMEILRYFMNSNKRYGVAGSIFNLLLLAVFPAVNVVFSFAFLDIIVNLIGGLGL